MEYGESFLTDCIDICPMLFKIEGKSCISSEDGIVEAAKAKVILFVKPIYFKLFGVERRFLCTFVIIDIEDEMNDLIVVVIGCHM